MAPSYAVFVGLGSTVTRYLFPLSWQVGVLSVFFDHFLLGFALRLGVFAVGFVLPLLHLLGSPKLRSLGGNFVGIAGNSQPCAENGEENPASDFPRNHDFSYAPILAAEPLGPYRENVELFNS